MLGVITFLNPSIVQRVRYSDFHFRDEENEAARGKASFFHINLYVLILGLLYVWKIYVLKVCGLIFNFMMMFVLRKFNIL